MLDARKDILFLLRFSKPNEKNYENIENKNLLIILLP